MPRLGIRPNRVLNDRNRPNEESNILWNSQELLLYTQKYIKGLTHKEAYILVLDKLFH
jgi:hypothetical protein